MSTYNINSLVDKYNSMMIDVLQKEKPKNIIRLCEELLRCRDSNFQVFICGNGGSSANADHLANDFMCVGGAFADRSIRTESLTSNNAINSCIANDLSYNDIFSKQLELKAGMGDVLIALSGSGNSGNIIKALEYGCGIGMKTFAILGFDGGKSKTIAKYPIHFPINDMQISEDLQLIVGHICMKCLKDYK